MTFQFHVNCHYEISNVKAEVHFTFNFSSLELFVSGCFCAFSMKKKRKTCNMIEGLSHSGGHFSTTVQHSFISLFMSSTNVWVHANNMLRNLIDNLNLKDITTTFLVWPQTTGVITHSLPVWKPFLLCVGGLTRFILTLHMNFSYSVTRRVLIILIYSIPFDILATLNWSCS